MENQNFKEVYFHLYCPTCKYSEKKEADDPCYDCLTIPARQDSHKPEMYESK